jgi:hypothetical protein
MLFQEIEEIFSKNSIKCGSHKKILSDLRLFDQEMDIDTLKSVKFLDDGFELIFELSIKNDLIIKLPQFYPFKIPEIYILSKDKQIEFKDFINKKKNKKEDIFLSFDKMFNEDISTISLNKILDEIMIILKPYKLGWLSY